MKVIAKLLKLRPILEKDQKVAINGYGISEEKWEMKELKNRVILPDLITKLIEIAAEYSIKERDSNSFLLSEVEAPGLRVVLGEGGEFDTLTILTPKPSYLRRILFVKCKSTGSCEVLYEFKPSSQIIVYDGSIETSGLDFDFAIIECDDHIRVLFSHELVRPRLRQRKRKSKRNRRKSKKKKSHKK